MRLAGYNTSRLNSEPMNGMGIYRTGESLAVTRLIANPVSPATLSIQRTVLAGVIVALQPLRDVIARVQAVEIDVRRDVRLLVDAVTLPFSRHLPSGVVRSLRILRRIPMIGHSRPGSITRASRASGITPHTSISSIGG